MADTAAKLNQVTEWSPASDTDTITCYDISQQVRNGVQIDVSGFDLVDATVTYVNLVGAESTLTVAADAVASGLAGEGYSMASISITGIAAGTYTVRFGQ